MQRENSKYTFSILTIIAHKTGTSVSYDKQRTVS